MVHHALVGAVAPPGRRSGPTLGQPGHAAVTMASGTRPLGSVCGEEEGSSRRDPSSRFPTRDVLPVKFVSFGRHTSCRRAPQKARVGLDVLPPSRLVGSTHGYCQEWLPCEDEEYRRRRFPDDGYCGFGQPHFTGDGYNRRLLWTSGDLYCRRVLPDAIGGTTLHSTSLCSRPIHVTIFCVTGAGQWRLRGTWQTASF